MRLLGNLLFLSLLGACQSTFATSISPDSDYIDNGDGTVLHKLNGLVWQRCAVGQVWDGKTCNGNPERYRWDEANKLNSNFAGKNDWRLPNIAELISLGDYDNFTPFLNKTYFPNYPPDLFWSVSLGKDGNIWTSWWYGTFRETRQVTVNAVRLVRGGQPIDVKNSAYTPSSAFTIHDDGTVTHNSTGLTWQRCAFGQTWDGNTCIGSALEYNWQEAKALASNLGDKNDWRLPNANELASVIEYSAIDPAINNAIFVNTPAANFWSSSPYYYALPIDNGFLGTRAWAVSFADGQIHHNNILASNKVRLVRGERRWYPDAALPELNALMVKLRDNNYQETTTTAKFNGGVGINYSGRQRYLLQSVHQGDILTVSGVITPDARHVGQTAGIIAVAAVQTVDPQEVIAAPDSCDFTSGNWTWYMNTQRDNLYCNWSELTGQPQYCNVPKKVTAQNYWQQWRGNLYELKALETVTLAQDSPFNLTVDGRGPLYKDKINYRNRHVCIHFGYRLQDGTTVFNRDSINYRTD